MKIAYSSLLLLSLNACASTTIDSENGLLVFVGEQIEIREFTPEVEEGMISMDVAFKANYRIIEKVYGEYDAPTIEFEAYDHYGFPEFGEYRFVLLFVSEHNGQFYHEKYQYFDVYKTHDDRWAYCGTPLDYEEGRVEKRPLEQVEFDPALSFNTLPYSDAYIKTKFPSPVYNHSPGKATCVRGVYLNELFRIKQEGILRTRGLFK